MQTKKPQTKLKTTVSSILVVADAFVWFLLAFNILKLALDQVSPNSSNMFSYETLLVFGVNAGAIAIGGLFGSAIIDKVKKRGSFLYVWMLSGIPLSIIPLGLNIADMTQLAFLSIIFGAYFGFGMPAAMGYHSASTNVEGRAKIGGVTFMVIGVTFSLVNVAVLDNLLVMCLALAAIRLFGSVAFRLTREEKIDTAGPRKVTYREIASNRSFLLYFIPWIMFSLINYTTIPIQQQLFQSDANFVFLSSIVENFIIAISAVVSGFIADKSGRKRLTMIGFILIGIGYATLGLLPLGIAGYIYVFADGTAWGIFAVVFLLTVWGDLAHNKYSEKFYLIGALPYLFSNFMRLLFLPTLGHIATASIFSFASVFLFLAVLPLVYAPETLPEKIIQERELKSYLDKALKKAQKEESKQKKETPEPSPEESSEEYDEAVKLAEKYY